MRRCFVFTVGFYFFNFRGVPTSNCVQCSRLPCDYVSDTLINLIPVLKDTRWWNNSRLNVDLIGKGSMRDGFQSREAAEVTYGVHILCAQGDLPYGSGTQQDYFNYLDYLNCVASRPEHNLLPLESCAED